MSAFRARPPSVEEKTPVLHHAGLPHVLVSLKSFVPHNHINVGKQEILESPLHGANIDTETGLDVIPLDIIGHFPDLELICRDVVDLQQSDSKNSSMLLPLSTGSNSTIETSHRARSIFWISPEPNVVR